MLKFLSIEEKGSALIGLLATVFLIASYVLLMWFSVKRLSQNVFADSEGLSALSLAGSNLSGYVRTIDDSKYPLDAMGQLPEGVMEFARQGYSPLVELSASGQYLGAMRSDSAFIAVRHVSPEFPQQPNWGGFFSELVGDSEESCDLWVKENGVGSQVFSARTCKKMSEKIERGTYIAGNVDVSKPLRFNGYRGETVSLVVAGALRTSAELYISNSSNSTLEIITAGDLSIKSIKTSMLDDVIVLLHSAGGVVEVKELEDNILECKAKNTGYIVAVEARDGMLLGSRAFQRKRFGGCTYLRSSILWKKFKVVGVRRG